MDKRTFRHGLLKVLMIIYGGFLKQPDKQKLAQESGNGKEGLVRTLEVLKGESRPGIGQ